jgi:hypothetical protein
MLTRLFAIGLLALTQLGIAQSALAQSSVDIQKVLDRLDRLESENQKLLDEIHALRMELKNGTAAATNGETAETPTVTERLDVEESRTAELAQSKVEASQRFPISLTGMLLVNAFSNGRYGGSSLNDPVAASLNPGPRLSGGTFRQTVIGLRFNGPDLIGGGKVSGALYMDFFGGSIAPNNNLVRLRIATLNLDWKNTSIVAGQDKPIVAPREPNSLAQMGVSPLTAAGNLWNWEPQVRIEQRFHFGESSGLVAQAGVYQTAENYGTTQYTPERVRPGYEARVEYFLGSDRRRFEIASGFHGSQTHVDGFSVPSRVWTLDWLARPSPLVEFTGAFFRGENVASLGSLRQGFTIFNTDMYSQTILPVHATGGWGQMSLFPAARGTFHFYGGEELDRASDLMTGGITSNFVYAGNFMYKLAPNVLAAFELSQARTNYLGFGLRLNNHYDLALAYLF